MLLNQLLVSDVRRGLYKAKLVLTPPGFTSGRGYKSP